MVLHVIGFRCTMMPKPLSRHLRMHGLSAKFGKIPEICKQYPQNITNTTEDVPCYGPASMYSAYA